jgi:hypothetical protein
MRTLMLLLLLGCPAAEEVKTSSLFDEPVSPAGADDTDTRTGSEAQVYGPRVDMGFGSVVLVVGSRVWAAAPHGPSGAVFQVVDGSLNKVAGGAGRLGSSLAMGPDGLWIGAPLRNDGLGAVLDLTGTVVVPGTGSTGLAMASGEPVLIAHGSGHSLGGGALQGAPGRPSALAQIEGIVGVAMATGETALAVDGRTLARPATADAAGFSLTTGDLDGDGEAEWILGAPGSDTVHIVDPGTLEIRHSLTTQIGSFGAALCAADFDGDGQDELLVGAPSAELTRGVVIAYASVLGAVDPIKVWTGDAVGDRLGTAVDCSVQVAALGAPGGASSTGHVRIVTGASIALAGAGSASRPAPPRSE